MPRYRGFTPRGRRYHGPSNRFSSTSHSTNGRPRRFERNRNSHNRLIIEALQQIGYENNNIGDFEMKRFNYLIKEFKLRGVEGEIRTCQSCHSWLYEFEGEEDSQCKKCCRSEGPIFADFLNNIPTVMIADIFQHLKDLEKYQRS